MTTMVYIAHPIGGDVENNIDDLLHVMDHVHTDETAPMAPYRTSVEYLDDDDPAERQKGVDKNIEYFERGWMDELWLTGPEISYGMTEEAKLADQYDIPIRYEPHLEESFRKLLEDGTLTDIDHSTLQETYTDLL